MHIGIDARLPYYQMGGISQYTLLLIQALAEIDEDNRYTIFHSRKDGRSHVPHFGRFERKDLWTPSHHRWERWTLAAELAPHKLDVLHSPDFIPPAAGAGRHVITIHDLNFLFFPEFLTQSSRRYYSGQIEWAVRKADCISADSEATRRDLIEKLAVPANNVITIPLAANPLYAEKCPETAVSATLAEYNLPRGFILAVGTLEPRKNYPMLFRAYHRLVQERKVTLPLVLVGGGGWLGDEILDTLENLELKEAVRHLKGVPDEKLAHLYRGAGVLVTPSHYEGFGLPALEAMHSGCPVIVSRRASLPEIVGREGLMLEPEDEEAWADSIYQILTDQELRRKMVAYGLVQAQSFSWEKTAKMTLALYEGS